MAKVEISIIVLNWNGQKYLKPLFEHLEKQTLAKEQFEVIMADNNSQKDNSVEFVRKEFPWVKIVQNDDNYGYAKGNNLGIVHAQGEYIVLLNNDTRPEPTWLAELYKVMKDKQAGAVVPKLMYLHKKNVINNAGSFIREDKSWPIVEQGANEVDKGQYDTVQEVTAFCGASVMLSRKMLDDIGLLDESFFMYFEDGDLSWRGQKKQWKYYLAPQSVVYHEHGGSGGEESPVFTFHVSRNRILILVKDGKLSLAARAYIGMVRDRLVKTNVRLIRVIFSNNISRSHTIQDWKMGWHIFGSSTWLSIWMLGKRWHIVPEKKLS